MLYAGSQGNNTYDLTSTAPQLDANPIIRLEDLAARSLIPSAKMTFAEAALYERNFNNQLGDTYSWAATTSNFTFVTLGGATFAAASTGYDALEQARIGMQTAKSAEEFDANVAKLKVELTRIENQRAYSTGAEALSADWKSMTNLEVIENIQAAGILSSKSEGIKRFAEQWGRNFELLRGPLGRAFVNATTSPEDVQNGYTLARNPLGILWRVNAAGKPHPVDLAAYHTQNRIIERTTWKTIEEMQESGFFVAEMMKNRDLSSVRYGIGGGGDDDQELVASILAKHRHPPNTPRMVAVDVSDGGPGVEVKKDPIRALLAAFSNAIYYDGSQKIPDGFRLIGGHRDKETKFYAEFFTDDKQIIVVFRGTDSWRAVVGSDLQLLLRSEVEQFPHVDKTIKELDRILAGEPDLQKLPIMATGHSLGGACVQYFSLKTGYRYWTETFGAPGIMGSVETMQAAERAKKNEGKYYDEVLVDLDLTEVANRDGVINHVNLYDTFGTSTLGGHVGTVRKYNMQPDNGTPSWISVAVVSPEHSMSKYQSYLGDIPVPPAK